MASPRWLIVGLAGLAAGCGWVADPLCLGAPCPSCPPPIEIQITNGPVAHLAATIPALELAASCSDHECTFDGALEPGDFEVLVTSDDFRPETVTVTVPEAVPAGCCDCGYTTQVVDVTLQASGP